MTGSRDTGMDGRAGIGYRAAGAVPVAILDLPPGDGRQAGPQVESVGAGGYRTGCPPEPIGLFHLDP